MDNHTPEQRRKNMQAVKNKDSKIELLLRKELWARGLRYRKNSSKIFGHPDIVFIGKKIAVFCDSEFWHGYDWDNRKNSINQRDIFQHVPIIFQKPVKPDSMGVPGFSPFGDVHMSFRIPPRLDARE